MRDSLYILDGLLEQETSLRPAEVMTHSASYFDQVFGLFRLLGYQFSPRLADIGEARFWRLDRSARYGALDEMARHRIDTQLITAQWDDLLRVAGSLLEGSVRASELLRTPHGGVIIRHALHRRCRGRPRGTRHGRQFQSSGPGLGESLPEPPRPLLRRSLDRLSVPILLGVRPAGARQSPRGSRRFRQAKREIGVTLDESPDTDPVLPCERLDPHVAVWPGRKRFPAG